jgi:hypothetical protein
MNAFLEGFLEEVDTGEVMDFFEYLASTLGTSRMLKKSSFHLIDHT